MSDETKRFTIEEARKHFGPALFNAAWDLIDKADRTPEETDLMIHCAHASRYFWQEHGTPLNLARGDWLLAHVYALAGKGSRALYYAALCHESCERDFDSPFDHAVAHTAMARAYAVLGDRDACTRHIKLARERGEMIPDAEEKNLHFEQLEAGPWFGLGPRE